MKLKVVPIVVAVVASASLLFGGWFIYHSVAMENPLNQALDGSPGVVSYDAKIDSSKTVFHVDLNAGANLREIVQLIENKNADVAGKRKAEINVTSNTTPQLEAWWSQALFDVAQAMETSRYADIPVKLNEKAGAEGLSVKTEMDDANVYVSLTEGEHSKFVILPRSPAKMGVWPNE